MTQTTVVLLPELDGTGELFAPLLAELPSTLVAQVVRYPVNQVLDYDALVERVRAELPSDRPYVLLGESFSGPIAIRLAAERPTGLSGVLLVATFHRRPVSRWLAGARSLVRDALFVRPPPGPLVRYALAGADAPAALVAAFRATVAEVGAEVLASRVRAVLDVDVSEALSRVEVPIAYFCATRDRLIRKEMADELRAIAPQLSIRHFDTAHLLLQRLPGESGRALEECVSRWSALAS